MPTQDPHSQRARTSSYDGVFGGHRKSVTGTLSIGTPLCPYPIAYRRAYVLSIRWTGSKNPSKSAVCGCPGHDPSSNLRRSAFLLTA